MINVTTHISYLDLLSDRRMIDALIEAAGRVRSYTVYHDPYSADLLIRWELAEFDPHFVQEDF